MSFKLKRCVLFTFLILFTFSIHLYAAASEISVSFSHTDFVVSYNPGEMNFTGYVTNSSEFGSGANLQMQLVNSLGELVDTFTAMELSSGSYTFYGTLPQRVGSYRMKYYAHGAEVRATASTPAEIKVRYLIDAKLSASTVRIDDEGVSIDGWITDRYNNPITNRPNFSIQGASEIVSTQFGNGYFTIRLGQITQAGPKGLRLFIDGVEIASWPVASSNLAGVSVSPGVLLANVDQKISVGASVYEKVTSGLRVLDSSDITLELTGVPIIASSVRDFIEAEYASGSSDVYERLVISARSLENNSIRFSTTGTLNILASTQSYRYQRELQISVKDRLDYDVLGAPALRTYAGDSHLDLSFYIASNKGITQYWAKLQHPQKGLIELQDSSSSLDRLPKVDFWCNGTGEIDLSITLLDRDAAQSTITRSFSYSVPSLKVEASSLTLGEESTITVTLEDSQGQPVNNAWVNIERVGSRNGSNGEAGEYVFSTKWNTTGYYRITALSTDGDLLADFSTMLRVQPPVTLKLEADNDVLLAGMDQNLRVRLLDEKGSVISSAKITGYVDNTSEAITFSSSSGWFTARVKPWMHVEIWAESSDGRQAAQPIKIVAAPPKVTSNISSITRGYIDHIELSFTHPETGDGLTGTMNIRYENMELALRNQKSNGDSAKEGSQFSLDAYSRVTKSLEDAMVYVDFSYNGRDYNAILRLPVIDPEIVFEPATLVRGSEQSVVVQMLNASGEPLQGVSISAIGQSGAQRTDENGKAKFSVRPGNADAVEFTIQRDDQLLMGSSASNFKVALPVYTDTKAPTITVVGADASKRIAVEESNYEIKLEIEDDVALSKLFFQSDPQVILSGSKATWSKKVVLKAGENVFKVRVSDSSGNTREVEFIVEYTPPAQPDPLPETRPEPGVKQDAITMVLGSLVVKRGDTVLAESPVPPKSLNGRTMLPFRYLCQTVLQGTVDYDAETRTIRTEVNGHLVEMIVDDPAILIDGEEVVLDQAPTLDGDHTLVPVRAFQMVVTSIGWNPDTATVTIEP